MADSDKKFKRIVKAGVMLYGIIIFILLFCREPFDIGYSYWDHVKMNINIIPFHTVAKLCRQLLNRTNPYLLKYTLVNLFGNIALFIPYGVLIPILFNKMRKKRLYLIYTSIMVLILEIVQLFSLRGSFDIDDFLLNIFGAMIGYLLFKIIWRVSRH